MKKFWYIILILFIVIAYIVYFIANQEYINKKSLVNNKKVLVAYFSATGNTKNVAEIIAKEIGADIYEIKPMQPYTEEDLDASNLEARSSIEIINHGMRPEIVKDDLLITDYDTIFLGFPIWWGIVPPIVNTFLESHFLYNKTIVLFGTSRGSDFGFSKEVLKPSVSYTTKIIKGRMFYHYSTDDDIKKWVETFK